MRLFSTAPCATIRGLAAGKLLVHVRVNDGTDVLRTGLDPSAGEFLRSTEAWQEAEDAHGEGPELIFFADDFSWATSDHLAHLRGASSSSLQTVFVRKNDTIFQDVGDGKVRTASGSIIRYELSDIADHEDPNFRWLPTGVEGGDWFTKQPQDVVAVVDVTDLRAVLSKMR